MPHICHNFSTDCWLYWICTYWWYMLHTERHLPNWEVEYLHSSQYVVSTASMCILYLWYKLHVDCIPAAVHTGWTAYPPYAGETVVGSAASQAGNLSNSLFGHTYVIITVQCMPGTIIDIMYYCARAWDQHIYMYWVATSPFQEATAHSLSACHHYYWQTPPVTNENVFQSLSKHFLEKNFWMLPRLFS